MDAVGRNRACIGTSPVESWCTAQWRLELEPARGEGGIIMHPRIFGAVRTVVLPLVAMTLPAPQLALASEGGIDHVAARPGAPYSAATKVDGILYISGQLGLGPEGKLADGFATQARQAMDNVKALVEAQGLSMDDVFKCTVMLVDMSNFAQFNPIYTGYFKPGLMPARTAVGVSGLPLGAALEIECMAKAT